jgi:hypothetical protein
MKYVKYIPLFIGLLATPLPALDAYLDGTTTYEVRDKFTMFYIYLGFRGKDKREVFGEWHVNEISGVNEFGHEIIKQEPSIKAKFTGKIVSGNARNGKIEVKFVGDVPYEELPKASQRFWKITPNDEYYTKIQVPMMDTQSGITYESKLEFSEQPYQGGN